MNDGDFVTEETDDERPDDGTLEETDIDSDEMLDGDVDAGGGSVIEHRNE